MTPINLTIDDDDAVSLRVAEGGGSSGGAVWSVDGKTGDVAVLPTGGTTGQVLKKSSGTDYDVEWADESGGGSSPSPSSATPQPLGTAAAGSSTDYSRADHVHKMPSASDVGALASNTTYVSTVNGSSGAVTLSIPSTAADVGAEPAVTEVTVSTAGDVSQSLDAGKIYHFTGAVSSLTLTLNAAGTGQLAQYHFDFDSGSTAATVTLAGVTWPDGSFVPEASKHYEVDILNGYGVIMAW